MHAVSALLAALSLALLTGCATPTDAQPSGVSTGPHIVAAFYPLAFVADQVAGDRATVTSLAAPGVEPHDVELSPAAVRDMSDADLVLRINGFQPAVDDAVESTGVESLDATEVVSLRDTDQGADPHFWLDPMLVADYGQALAAELSRVDPAGTVAYYENANALSVKMQQLDSLYTQELANCERHEMVTAHASLGYLADAYGLTQVGIAGIDPHAEPSPARIREIAALVEATGATTIFAESTEGSSVIEAIATDAGVTTDVLSPLEMVSDDQDYISVMHSNLVALKAALACD